MQGPAVNQTLFLQLLLHSLSLLSFFSSLSLLVLQEYISIVRPMVRDTVVYLHKAIKEHKNIIVEGANATMLDIDFGTVDSHYSHLISSNILFVELPCGPSLL